MCFQKSFVGTSTLTFVRRTFQLSFEKDLGINFSAFKLDHKTGRRGALFQYSRLNSNLSLLSWVEDVIMKVPV